MSAVGSTSLQRLEHDILNTIYTWLGKKEVRALSCVNRKMRACFQNESLEGRLLEIHYPWISRCFVYNKALALQKENHEAAKALISYVSMFTTLPEISGYRHFFYQAL